MLSKIMGFLMSIVMFFSSFFPSIIKGLGIGNKAGDIAAEIKNYVSTNLPVFHQIFDVLGEAFYATSVEKVIPCTVIDENGNEDEAAYVDFNGDYGYLIISMDKFVYAYKCEGNLPQINTLDSVIYSVTDGFVYLKDGEYIPYDFEENKPDKNFTFEYFHDYFNYISNDGSIDDPDAYVEEQYGDGYVTKSENELEDFDYLEQFDTSIYLEYSEDKTMISSEGNCAPTAMTSMFSYIAKMAGKTTDAKFSSLPKLTDTDIIYATEDPFFEKYKNNVYDFSLNPTGNYKINGYNFKTGDCTGYEVPALYKDIRTYIINNYGYETGGLAPAKFKEIVPVFMNKYGIDDENVKGTLDVGSFGSFVKPKIDKGYPVLWSVYNSTTYDDHTTTVTGYKIYTKTVEVNSIKVLSDLVILLEINDNWAGKPVYFDYTKFCFGEGYFYSLDK